MVGYLFDPQKGETPTSLARRRKLAEAMLAQSLSRTPKNIPEGLLAIGDALVARVEGNRADKAEREGLEGFAGKWGDVFDGPGEFPSAPSTTRDTSYSPPSRADQDASLGSSVDFARAKPNDLAAGIRETAKALGIDPIDLGTAISYETAGSFDPTKKGPTTQWGQHRGLIQFGEPQAAKYGVNWDDPVGSQLGADGAVAKYLRDTGVKPGMGMLDIYSAINAGGVGRYGASDANNGGAPGTVADKVNNQMAGHRRKALELLGGGEEPVQVASLDQSIGLASPEGSDPVEKRRRVVEALASSQADRQPDPIRAKVADALIGQRGGGINVASMREQQMSRLLSPDVIGDGASFVQTSRDAPIQMAQARNGQMSDADALAGFGARPYQQGQGGPSLEQLYQLAADPWASEEQRAILGNMIKQKQAENAPPEYDFVTGRDGAIFRTDNRGNLKQVYGGKPDKPANIQEYEYYVAGEQAAGRQPLGPLEYEQALRRSGATTSNVNIDQKTEGAFDKKLAEQQAETFNNLMTDGMNARSDLAVIGELGGLLQGQGGTLTGLAGNLAKYGIGGEGMDDVQAAQALINKLVPSMRQPGSGSMSDRDVELFSRSLPSLWNSPGGNAKILGVMNGLANYRVAQGDIASKAANGEITRQEAVKMLRELPNPLAEFTAPKKGETPLGDDIEELLKKYGG